MSGPGEPREGSAEIADVRGARKVALGKPEDRLGSAASPGPAPPPPATPHAPSAPPGSPASRLPAPGDGGARAPETEEPLREDREVAGGLGECGLHVDVALPVTASCGPRRRGRTDRRRRDRRTPRSRVSGAPVAGALGPLSPDTRPPRAGSSGSRAPLRGPGPRLPGSAATGESPRGLGALAARVPRRRLPVAAALRGAPSPRTCRGSAASGSPGARGCPESWGQCGQRWQESKRAPGHCGQRSMRGGGGAGGCSLPGQSPWRPPAVPGDQGTDWGMEEEAAGLHGRREPVRGAERGEAPPCPLRAPSWCAPMGTCPGRGQRRGLGTGVDACPGPTGAFSPPPPK